MAEAETDKSLMAENSPPAYTEEANADPESQAPPPSYNSIFGELKQAKQESSSFLDFVQKFFKIIFATVGFLILMSLMLAIPIACVAIGAMYKDDCTIEPLIPIYLIVAGAFGIFRNLIAICCKASEKHQERQGQQASQPGAGRRGFEGLIDCFLLAWFICGNVWIYKNYQPVYDLKTSAQYCHQTLYLFAFWLTTATYILMGTFCVCGCCIMVCLSICS